MLSPVDVSFPPDFAARINTGSSGRQELDPVRLAAHPHVDQARRHSPASGHSVSKPGSIEKSSLPYAALEEPISKCRFGVQLGIFNDREQELTRFEPQIGCINMFCKFAHPSPTYPSGKGGPEVLNIAQPCPDGLHCRISRESRSPGRTRIRRPRAY